MASPAGQALRRRPCETCPWRRWASSYGCTHGLRYSRRSNRFASSSLAQLYFDRWQVEVNLRHLKQTLHLDVLRSKSVDGIKKELCMIALAYNLVRLVMVEAARRQEVTPDRVSFIDALRWLSYARPNQPLRNLKVHRIRHRLEPRVRKRRPKQYPLMNRPRVELRQALARQ